MSLKEYLKDSKSGLMKNRMKPMITGIRKMKDQTIFWLWKVRGSYKLRFKNRNGIAIACKIAWAEARIKPTWPTGFKTLSHTGKTR
jgi:hypothetical protein